jgi:hypothetical protein
MAKLRVRAVFSIILCLLCVFCNRTVGGGRGSVASPNPDGTSCNNDVECASNHCSGNTCQPPANGEVEIDGDCSGGAPCVADATCDDGICVENASACAALLALCVVDDDCCSRACATPPGATGGTCTAGVGMCAGEGSSCITNSDCCAGLCDFRMSPSSGQGQCSTACIGFGEACEIGNCCSGYCATEETYAQCAACLTPTIADGHPCQSDSDCCGETCVGATSQSDGTCQCTTTGGCGP